MVKHIRNPIVILILLLAFPLVGICQLPFPKWVNDIGGSGDSKPTGMITDSQNNIYVSGYFSNTVDFDPSPGGVKNLTSQGSYDIYVAKYKPDGTLIWAVSMGGDALDQVNNMTVDASGNPTIIGQFQSSTLNAGAVTLHSVGGDDIFIIHLDKDGNVLWGKSIGGFDTDRGEEVTADSQGNLIATAIFQSTINVEGNILNATGGFNGLIIKYDSSGNLLWYINIGQSGDTEIFGNGTDSNGNIVVSGTYSGIVDFDPLGGHHNSPTNGLNTPFITKYTPAGKLIWINFLSGSILPTSSALSIDANNDIYVTASFFSSLTFNGSFTINPQGQDTFFAKYSSNGIFQYAKDLGGSGASSFNYQIRNDQYNNVYLTGYFSGTVDFNPDPVATANVAYHGQRDFYIAKFDTNGNYQWAFNGGSISCDLTFGIELAIDNNNDVILGGSFCQTIDFDPSTCVTDNVTAQNSISDTFISKYIQGTAANALITTFALPQQTSPAVIDQVNHTITITVAAGTNVAALTPTITVSNSGTVSPASGALHDFTLPATYTVTLNCASVPYTVKVISSAVVKTAVTCAGSSKTITGDVVNPVPDSYNWQVLQSGVWVNAPGVIINKDYQTSALTNGTGADIVYSLRRQISVAGNISYDSYYDVTVQPVIAISNNLIMQPAVNSFCVSGDPAIITGSTPTGGNGIYTFQWQSSVDDVNFTDIAGATSNDYDPPLLNATAYYRRTVTSDACVVPTLSNVVKITVTPAISNNTITAPAIITFCENGNPANIIGSIPAGGSGSYAYQWQSSADNLTFTDISGATGKNFDPPLVNVNTYYRRSVTSGVCIVPLISNVITITVLTTVANNTITEPAINSFCVSGDPAAILGSTPTGGDANNYTYQWQSSANNISFTDIAKATGKDYDPAVLSTTMYYRRTVTSGVCIVPMLSNVVTITVLLAVANNTITPPAVVVFCASGNASVIVGSIATGGTGVYNYQWQSSTDNITFTDITGAASEDFVPPVANVDTWYRRTVTSGACTIPLISNVVKVAIIPAIASNTVTAPAVTNFCATGDATIITGSAPTGGNGTYAYQWQQSTDNITFTDITGAITIDFDPPVLNATTYYRRTVTSGVCVVPAISNVATITILQAVANNIITAPAVTAFCQNGDAATIVGSIPTNGAGTYNYQWQSSTDNLTFTDISGATSKDFDPPAGSITVYYRRAVASGVCNIPVISNVITISVLKPIVNNGINAPLFTTFCSTVDPGIIPGTFPTGGNGTYNYQWQSSTDNINFTDIAGATAADYNPSPINVTTYIHRLVTSGACNVPMVSNVVVFTILSTPVAPVPTNAAVPICSGNTASLSVASPQTGLVYDWYDSPSETNHLFTGATYVTGQLNSSQTYYVTASNSICTGPPAAVQINVNPVPAAPSLVKTSVAVCDGSVATLSILSPQNGVTYNWYSTLTGGSLIFTGTDLITPAIKANTIYYAEAVNSSGCISLSRTAANVADNPLPTVIANGNSVCPGLSASLTTNNADANVKINWYSNASGGSLLFSGNTFTTPAINADATYYAEAVNIVSGCISAARAPALAKVILPLAAPVVKAGTTTTSSVTFEWGAVTGATAYQVSTDNGQTFTDPSSGSDGLSHTITGLQLKQSVTLRVRAIGSSPCQLSAGSTAVTNSAVSPLGNLIFVPNAFTPNRDGKNDVIYVHSENIKSIKFYVYDQWGELLYTSTSQQKGWDGNYKGTVEPVGVYVYYLEAVMSDGQQVNKKGTITLLR